MSESPDRTVTGLSRRRPGEPDLSRMRRGNREAPAGPAAAPLVPPPTQPAATAPVPPPRALPKDAKTKTTVYLDPELTARAKATFKATAHLEQDRSWSEFVEKAITAEIHRRQDRHNAGASFGSDPAPLNPGRPLA